MAECLILSCRVVGPNKSRVCYGEEGIRGTRRASISSLRRRITRRTTYALESELSTLLHYSRAYQLPAYVSRGGRDEPIVENHRVLVAVNPVSLTVPSSITSSSSSSPLFPIEPHSSRSSVERQWGFGSKTSTSYAGVGVLVMAWMVVVVVSSEEEEVREWEEDKETSGIGNKRVNDELGLKWWLMAVSGVEET
jgi:hypothetical protein